MRRHITFSCDSEILAGTLDNAAGDVGVLIVSGGNEIRAGAWNGMAQLAARLAASGYPVFRFDRRGVGDSTGENTGFEGSAADIDAALRSFRMHCRHLRAVAAFGNCDAASALMLHHAGLRIDQLLLANPWTFDAADPAQPAQINHSPAEIRRRYLSRIVSPSAWKRLLTGAIDLRKLGRGIAKAATAEPKSQLATQLQRSLARYNGETSFLIAQGDRTGQAFISQWPSDDLRIRLCASASHSFSDDAARDWLFSQITDALNCL